MNIALQLPTVIDRFLAAIVRLVRRSVSGRYPFLVITVIATLLAFLLRFPPYELLQQVPLRPANQAMTWQIQHPLTPIPTSLQNISLYGGSASHVDKMGLRLTLPLLGRVSGTGPWTVVVWSSIAAVLLFYFLARCAWDAIGDQTASALFVIGLGATFFGAWGFNDFDFGDAVAFLLMLLCIYAREKWWLVVPFFLAAAFCDERAVAAFPLLAYYFFIGSTKESWKKQSLAITSAALLWVVLRYTFAVKFHLSTGTSMLGWSQLRAHMSNYGNTVPPFIGAFRASWLIPALAIYRLVEERRWWLAACLVGASALVIGSAFLVFDLNRSVCYGFPVLLISARLLWRNGDEPKRLLAAILLINICMSPPSKTILRLLTVSTSRPGTLTTSILDIEPVHERCLAAYSRGSIFGRACVRASLPVSQDDSAVYTLADRVWRGHGIPSGCSG